MGSPLLLRQTFSRPPPPPSSTAFAAIRSNTSSITTLRIAISENWLHDYNIHSIQQLHPDYNFIAACPPHQEHPTFCVPHLIRDHGGVAFGWHTCISHLIGSTLFIHAPGDWSCDGNLSGPCVCVPVYLPSRSGCTDIYIQRISRPS